VNNNFFEECTDGVQTGCSGSGKGGGGGSTGTSSCPSGEAELSGTGFSDPGQFCNSQQSSGGGATGWLTTSAPVQPGEVMTIEFMIWDTGDASYDSSVVLDNFVWSPAPVQGTNRPPK
jgi:hypothetical protein